MIGFILFFLSLFPCLEETIPDGPFVYKGLYPREQILINPENCPVLEKTYSAFLEQLEEDLNEEEVLNQLSISLRNKVFDPHFSSQESVQNYLDLFFPFELEPIVPLDNFIEDHVGICRHYAMTASYILDRLVKEKKLIGNVYLIRDEIPAGRHAWTLFLTKSSAWHLDCYLNYLEDGKTEKGFLSLCHKYGKRTMERQKQRWQ